MIQITRRNVCAMRFKGIFGLEKGSSIPFDWSPMNYLYSALGKLSMWRKKRPSMSNQRKHPIYLWQVMRTKEKRTVPAKNDIRTQLGNACAYVDSFWLSDVFSTSISLLIAYFFLLFFFGIFRYVFFFLLVFYNLFSRRMQKWFKLIH